MYFDDMVNEFADLHKVADCPDILTQRGNCVLLGELWSGLCADRTPTHMAQAQPRDGQTRPATPGCSNCEWGCEFEFAAGRRK